MKCPQCRIGSAARMFDSNLFICDNCGHEFCVLESNLPLEELKLTPGRVITAAEAGVIDEARAEIFGPGPGPMTNEMLDEIEAYCQAATPGPWVKSESKPWDVIIGLNFRLAEIRYPHDLEFIVRARTDFPALLAEIKRLRAIVKGHEANAASICEALNMGDGTYEP